MSRALLIAAFSFAWGVVGSFRLALGTLIPPPCCEGVPSRSSDDHHRLVECLRRYVKLGRECRILRSPERRRVRQLIRYSRVPPRLEQAGDDREQFGRGLETLVDQKHHVRKIADTCVRAVAVRSGEGVRLLREVLPGIDDLNVAPLEACEVEHAGELDSLRLRDLVVAGNDVEPHVRKSPRCHARLDGEAPSGPPRFIERNRHWQADPKLEPVFLAGDGEQVGEQLADIRAFGRRETKGEVEIAGAAGPIPEPYLESHASLHNPPTRGTELKPHEETLECDAAAKALEIGPRLPRLVAEAGFKGLPERCRRLIRHRVPPPEVHARL